MKINVYEDSTIEPRVDIHCKTEDERISRLKKHIELFDQKLCVQKNGETFYINADNIFYFETVDERTFVYLAKEVFEIKLRLYELEQALSEHGFLRISRSVIVNLSRIFSLRPQLNRTVLATMENGERLIVSRSHVKHLRNTIGL